MNDILPREILCEVFFSIRQKTKISPLDILTHKEKRIDCVRSSM